MILDDLAIEVFDSHDESKLKMVEKTNNAFILPEFFDIFTLTQQIDSYTL